ncbi:hypothetical protein [Halocatena pleomorpha]|uniref:hypothetical protein n=1 Tax=Halocatena pleomorpha TaxID=1785090 RepID=UPI00163AF61F|nr:hypothetical protein [Halocatena pleomorpha]
MRHTVHDTFAAAFESYSIVRQLHDVPPHEVYEVTVNGHRAVYKGDTGPTGNAAIEVRVAAFIGEQTSVPVPRILLVGDDHFVAAWHPDAPQSTQEGTQTKRGHSPRDVVSRPYMLKLID